MQVSSHGPTPQSGDVILSRTRDASRRYTLSTLEGAAQMACKTYAEALAQVDRFAQSQHVDVWKTDNDRAFTRVIACRVASSTRQP